MTTVGRWSPNKVRARVLDGTWVSTEELGGMVLLTPSSIAYTGTSASIGTNGSVEFTAVSSLSLNGVFDATYDNYVVTMGYSAPASDSVAIRWRASGTDDTGATSYVRQSLVATSTAISAGRTTSSSSLVATTGVGLWNGVNVHIYSPYLAQPTAYRNTSIRSLDGARIYDFAGTHDQSTSYDGFTIFQTTTLTGSLSVYGLVGA